MRRRLAAALASTLLVVFIAGAANASSKPAEAPSSSSGIVAQVDLPAAPATGLSRNGDAEPGVAVAPDGTLWATAFTISDPPSGQDIWKSTDGGRTWQWVASPFNIPPSRPLLGGQDADVAVATDRNASGQYNVYVAGLWVAASPDDLTIGDISLAISTDGGRTWVVDPLAADIPGDDRPWLAADGACTVYLVYHALPTLAVVVDQYNLCNLASTALGLTLTPVASTRYVSLAVPFVLQQKDQYVAAGFGKVAVDSSPESPYRNRIYIPEMDCPALTPIQELMRVATQSGSCPGTEHAEVYLELSSDGGMSWTEVPVATSDDGDIAIWPEMVATDAEGRVYLVWHDEHNAWLDVSDDGGLNWTKPLHINSGLGAGAYPTVAAAGNGVVDIAWYGANRTGDANDVTTMGIPGAAGSARWSLWVARSIDAGRTFQRFVADPLVHTGVLCTYGDSCSGANVRDLFDDFGVTISPTTGSATVLYTSDQPGSTRADDSVHSVTFGSR